MSSAVFYYDVVCPFAYMASRLVEGMARRAGATITWKPVLLGGLYDATAAPQGKAGSAMDVMSPSKLRITGADLHRQMSRRAVPYREPVSHPQKTVYAMRILAGIDSHKLRVSASHALFKAYWVENKDLANMDVLAGVVAPLGVAGKELVSSESASALLRANTQEAADRGAFGVPGFYVCDRLFWGTDRMFFVERALGVKDAVPERLLSPPATGGRKARLTFFFDYSSPWSYLGCCRLDALLRSVSPVEVSVEWVPILLGALFKSIGTPVVPMTGMSPVKVQYMQQDLKDWTSYAGVGLQWPEAFPLRTVLPLRVTLAAGCPPQLIHALYSAAWRENKDIGQEEVLREVLAGTGHSGEELLQAATSEHVKGRLFENTKRAVEEGVCGVPSFSVDGGPVVWGQDKLNVVADMLCGWKDTSAKL